ncbi:MAG: DUF885 domain-containing protein [Wenzhouxiangellaceae bacterium]|nr:DUF885 domain-containing protein [Wenzhouxiangellaceae bacterium]
MIRKILKWTGYSALVAFLLVSAFAINVIWFKPVTLNLFFERTFLQFGLNSPQALTMIGILDGFPIKFYQGKLDEVSVARVEEMNDWVGDSLETLHRYDREDYEGQKALSYDIFEWFLEKQVEGERWTWHGFPVNQMFGIHTSLPNFMLQMHPVKNERDVDFYLERLTQFPDAFGGMVDVLYEHDRHGVVPPRFAVEKPLAAMRAFIDQAPNENPLHVELLKKVDAIDDFPAGRREQLPAELSAAIEAHVYPAYATLIDYYESLLNDAKSNDGVWRLPDGDEYYAYQVGLHTTTDFSPEQVHQIGLSEVNRIESEMDAILCRQGYCEDTVGARMAALNEESRFLFEDSDAGREQILSAFEDIISEAQESLDDWFDVRPSAEVEVKRVPEFSEEGSAGAYYQPPALNGSRPGVFFAKLQNVEEHPRFGLRTLAYHEAVPGHHFQIALAQQIEGVPMFRKMLPFTAYSEGWALYAERVAHEAGLHPDPFSELGRLQAEMFRGVRLVVDTGMHHKRWSREQAIDYMAEKTGMARTDVVAEIERYLVMPGQALAYKTGMMKILQLRERARSTLGERFDIREFHNVVLMNGSMPLGILEQVIDDWIAGKA